MHCLFSLTDSWAIRETQDCMKVASHALSLPLSNICTSGNFQCFYLLYYPWEERGVVNFFIVWKIRVNHLVVIFHKYLKSIQNTLKYPKLEEVEFQPLAGFRGQQHSQKPYFKASVDIIWSRKHIELCKYNHKILLI